MYLSIVRTRLPSPPPPVVYYARDGYSESDETASLRLITQKKSRSVSALIEEIDPGSERPRPICSSFSFPIPFNEEESFKGASRERPDLDLYGVPSPPNCRIPTFKTFFQLSFPRYARVATDRSKTEKVRRRVERVLESVVSSR